MYLCHHQSFFKEKKISWSEVENQIPVMNEIESQKIDFKE